MFLVARNEERRNRLADAGLAILAAEGSRGLTHRAVDREAHVPIGTTSNYFRDRRALISGLVERIGQRLAPTADFLAERADRPPTRELFTEYLQNIVDRLLADPQVTVALLELRLESTRRPEVAESLGQWQRTSFDADVEFNVAAGFPGAETEIALFHYAIDGLVLDQLTTPLLPGTSTAAIVDRLVAGLLPPE
nr:TetR/AcrR family transcriptional regulator [Gordonia araii]